MTLRALIDAYGAAMRDCGSKGHEGFTPRCWRTAKRRAWGYKGQIVQRLNQLERARR